MKTMLSLSTPYHFNPSLIRVMVKYLSPKDLCSLSLVSKFCYSIAKEFDYRFKEICYRNFCSDYETFSIEINIERMPIIMSTSFNINNLSQNEQQIEEKSTSSNISWKELLNNGVFLKKAWDTDINCHMYQDITLLKDMLYDRLKETKSYPKLRMKNTIIETEFNSPLQLYLYDFLYDQQELYEKYDEIFIQMKLNGYIESIRKNLPFCYLITNYVYLQNIIKTEKDKLQLQYARWYYIVDKPEMDNSNKGKDNLFNNYLLDNHSFICFKDENDNEMGEGNMFSKNIFKFNEINDNSHSNKKVKITVDFVKSQLSNESNQLFSILKCLCMTLMFYCQYTMMYLYHTYNIPSNPNILLNEYLKRYKNYVETAIELNNQLENVNVFVNYLYESFFPNYPTFPKFSVFRMSMLIWNNEMTNLIDDNESMLSCIKISFTSFYSNILHDNLEYYFKFDSYINNINPDALFSHALTNLTQSTHSSANYTLLTNEINVDKKVIRDSSSQYIIIEQILSSIIDSFCNEYSVFSLNQFKISSNSTYEEIEGNMLESIENEINFYFQSKVVEGEAQLNVFVKEIIRYFTSGFYSERIINQLKRKIYQTIQQTIKNIVNYKIKAGFELQLGKIDLNLINESEAYLYLRNNNSFKSMDIYQILLEEIAKITYSPIITEFVVVKYLSSISSDPTASIVTKEYLDDWFNEENAKIIKKNKQIFKEIDNKAIPTDFDENQLMLLSLFERPKENSFNQEQICETRSEAIEEDINMVIDDKSHDQF